MLVVAIPFVAKNCIQIAGYEDGLLYLDLFLLLAFSSILTEIRIPLYANP